jgi:hypothetical protein
MTDRADFDRLKDEIQSALEFSAGTHTIEDVWDGIQKNDFQLWTGIKSVIITEIVVYPRKKNLHFFLAGGDLDEIKIMRVFIEQWGKSIGCSMASICGRRGWEKALQADGYKRNTWYTSKDLKD